MKKDSYSPSRIDDTLNTITGSEWFSTLDFNLNFNLKITIWPLKVNGSLSLVWKHVSHKGVQFKCY